MGKQSANQLKAKKQISNYTSQAMYAGMQNGFQMYRVVRKSTNEVVGEQVTMKQFIRQFSPLTHFNLEPLK
jgi:hypothetical protein